MDPRIPNPNACGFACKLAARICSDMSCVLVFIVGAMGHELLGNAFI